MDNPLMPTGYAATCRLTAKELARRGHQVYTISFNGGPQQDTEFEWYGIKVLPNTALKRNPNAGYGDAQTIIDIHKSIKPDIFFFHNDSYRYAYVEQLPEEILSKSVFWLPFEGDRPDVGGIERVFGKCAATRFVTKYALGFHADLMKGADLGYIPHAVDLEALKPCKDKEEVKASKLFEVHQGKLLSYDEKQDRGPDRKPFSLKGKFVVSRVDRHQPRKFWTKTLEAFAKFAKDKDDVVLLAKCDPRDMCMYNHEKKEGLDLEAIATKLGIRDKVFFDSFFFAVEDMPKAFYHPADVFVSTTSGEGFGLALVESLACGTPVICSDVPVLPEVLGKCARLCRVAGQEWYDPLKVTYAVVDPDAVAKELEWAYADYKSGGKELKELGDAGVKRANEMFSPKAVYDAWDKVFADVLDKRDLVSVVTVLFNMTGKEQIEGEDGVAKMAASILANVKHPHEWILVDNGSPAREETRAWMQKAAAENPRIRTIFLDENHGYAGANNVGIAAAKGKWVVLANPDSEALSKESLGLPHDWLGTMVAEARRDPMIGIIGMEINRRDDIMLGVAFPYFCNVLLSRRCLDAVKIAEGKWFDEAFWPAYYEDCDLVLRAMSRNFKVTSVNAPFWHKSGGTNRHAVKGGKDGPFVSTIRASMEAIRAKHPSMADFGRKAGELEAKGMQGLIDGNIAYLNSKWGKEERAKIKVVWNTHIGDAVGFSQIAEGLIPELHGLGFDVYVNDWSNGAKVEDPLIRDLILKTRKFLEGGGDLSQAINIVCWLMESFHSVDADFKVGTAFCESTRVRPHYQQFCNSMDRILTFSEFCRGVQKDSGFTVPIEVICPGVHPVFMNHHPRTRKKKFTFIAVGVAQDRKDTRRLVQAFCEAFPKGTKTPPECSPEFPYHCDDVQLIIKSNNFGDLGWITGEGYDKRANVVAMFTGDDPRASRKNLSMQEMYDLYCEADCLVHPSHGEGIGMPILEAAATGMPVIFTNWSSPAEYLDAETSYPCSLSSYPGTTFTTAYLGHGRDGENGLWANIHIGHMKLLMYTVIKDHEKALKVGSRAAEHVKENYNWARSARMMMPLIFEWEAERKRKAARNDFDPVTYVKPTLEPVKKGDRVMIDICSRDRHPYLATLLLSLLNQTFKDWDVIIQCDDSDDTMPKDHQLSRLVHRAQHEGHGWSIIRSYKQGPHIAHDRTLQMTLNEQRHRYKLICRIDDDIYVRPDFLQNLFDMYLEDKNGEIGAISGVYLDPVRPDHDQLAPKGFESNIEYAGLIDHNVPWPYICLYPEGTAPRKMEHLYSSFMYRTEVAKSIGGYCRLYSQIGHREESDFSYRFHLAGFKLFVNPKAVGYHFAAPAGGIRSDGIGHHNDKVRLAEGDHKIYQRRLKRWKERHAERKLLETKKSQEQAKVMSWDDVKPEQASGKEYTFHVKNNVAKTYTEKPRVVVAMTVAPEASADKAAMGIEYFSQFGDVYVTCPPVTAIGLGKITMKTEPKMVATDEASNATMAKAMLAEGDHGYVMCVTESMRFQGDPTTVLDEDHDDYVFEVHNTYKPGRKTTDSLGNPMFVIDPSLGTTFGPELRNECLIHRKGGSGTPNISRTLYADMMVLNDVQLLPVDGKSNSGHDLVRLADLGKKQWTKYCYFQFPDGLLSEPDTSVVEAGPPKVSIIIPTPGRREWLRKCIDSIYAHTTTPFEIIVIDNASQDGTAEYLQKEAATRHSLKYFRQDTNLGYQKAINLGVSKSSGEYILLFNDDAWVDAPEPNGMDWLEVYIDELKDPKVGIVGPHEGTSPALGSKMLFFWCVMMRRSTIDEVGPLDDITFRNYGGDDDYCERLRRKGYEIRCKYAHLRHLMTLVPDHVKKPELTESEIKLKAKWAK